MWGRASARPFSTPSPRSSAPSASLRYHFLAVSCFPLPTLATPPADFPLSLPFFVSPRAHSLPASASPAPLAYRVSRPAERVLPRTPFSRSPPPKFATPAPQASHSSASCRSSSSHTHAPAAPS